MQDRRWTRSAKLVPACVLLLAGCDAETPRQSPYRNRRTATIALIGASKDHPTWEMLLAAAHRFEKLYPSTRIEPAATDTFSPTEQADVLAALLDEEINAVCVIPSDPGAIRDAINRLAGSGNPVVTIGRDSPDSARSVFCGPSDSAVGRSAAAACGLVLQGRASRTVMVLHGETDRRAHRYRLQALLQALPLHGNVRVLRQIDSGGHSIEALRRIRLQSRLFPRAGCWALLEDRPLRALQPDERLLSTGAGIVLFTGSPTHFDRLRNGELQAIVTFDYFQAVEDGLLAAHRLITSETPVHVAATIATPTEIITIEELNSFARRWEGWRRGIPSPAGTDRGGAAARSESMP